MPECSLYRQCDFHVHTHYSPCAEPDMLPADIVRRANEAGVKYLGLTDHIFGFTDPEILKRVRLESPSPDSPQIFFGCEADVMSVGKTAVTEEMIASLDYVMVSASHFYNDRIKMVEMPVSDDPEVVGKHYLKMFKYAATLDYVDVIAHPFFVMPGTFDVNCVYTLTESDLTGAIEVAAKHKVAVEMSRRAVTPEHIDFMRVFYRLCKDAELKFSIGSDAHNLDTVGQTDVLGHLIEELGLRDDDLWLPGKNGGSKQ